MEFKYDIKTDWKGDTLDHDPVHICLNVDDKGIRVAVCAPFFNDPADPGGEKGQPFAQLWDYEVVEIFFLDNQAEEYLEAEFCPHGQHQILVLKGRRKIWKSSLELDRYEAEINGDTWIGTVVLPWAYFPKNVDKMNAYAIHGSGNKRQYEALYPATGHHDAPDFHRLQYFERFHLSDACMESRRDVKIWGQ